MGSRESSANSDPLASKQANNRGSGGIPGGLVLSYRNHITFPYLPRLHHVARNLMDIYIIFGKVLPLASFRNCASLWDIIP